MELILFKKGGGGPELLERQGRLELPRGESLEVFRSIPGLAARLRGPVEDFRIVILVAADRQELRNLLDLGHLLAKAGVFLIVPEEEAETLALAHCLRPRYLGSLSQALAEMPAVLGKMIRNHRQGQTSPPVTSREIESGPVLPD